MFLPYTECRKPHHWHLADAINAASSMHNGCPTAQVSVILSLLSTSSTAYWFNMNVGQADNACYLAYSTPRAWAPVVEAAVHAHYDPENTGQKSLSYNDMYCQTCQRYVSHVLDAEHWENLCNECTYHSDECTCCDNCHYADCVCCSICNDGPSWNCGCCSECENTAEYCECDTCEECGHKTQECGCGNSSGHTFGESKKAPWSEREDNPMEVRLPRIAECQHSAIDPIQAAADFYLLDAIKNMVRMSNLTGGDLDRFNADRTRLIDNDNMLSALKLSAERSYRTLVDYLAPNFLAYAVPAVGGELRYHRAVSIKYLPAKRESAWDTFVSLVETKGAETLFEADKLFREFEGGAYGGKKWGDAAKVIGQYLNGTMPAWLFVDRVFTLQHNGGCFLNKVSWARKNGLHWSLSKILYVLNAHAGKDANGDEDPRGTDWQLLMACASPGVAHMFMLAEKNISRIGRRYGADLPPLAHKRRVRNAYGD